MNFKADEVCPLKPSAGMFCLTVTHLCFRFPSCFLPYMMMCNLLTGTVICYRLLQYFTHHESRGQ